MDAILCMHPPKYMHSEDPSNAVSVRSISPLPKCSYDFKDWHHEHEINDQSYRKLLFDCRGDYFFAQFVPSCEIDNFHKFTSNIVQPKLTKKRSRDESNDFEEDGTSCEPLLSPAKRKRIPTFIIKATEIKAFFDLISKL